MVDIINKNDIVVDLSGSDENDGTVNSPLASVNMAKNLLKGYTSEEPVTVWIKQGTYYISETLAFTSEDRQNVTYRAFNGEEVVISGAVAITGFKEEILNGKIAFTADVKNINNFNELFNNGERLERPRYPKEGYFNVRDVLDSDALQPESHFFKSHTAFLGNSDEIIDFYDCNNVLVRILHYWKDEMINLSSVDLHEGKIFLNRPASMTINKNDRYYFENVFESLGNPGEWYLDRKCKKLWYIPKEGENADSLVLYAGNIEQFITINGINGISFKGIKFEQNNWNVPSPAKNSTAALNADFPQAALDSTPCIEVKNANDINFEDCIFINIGASGIYFGYNVKNSAINGCTLNKIGANPIFIMGENVETDSPFITKNIAINNNHIHEYGIRFFNAVGILLIHANSCEIMCNEIHNGYYTGISAGWVWGYNHNITDSIIIKNNLIYDIGKSWLSDMGGIYTLGIQPNTVISGNVIHDISANSGLGGYGGWGIYLDEGSSFITVSQNLVYKCNSSAFHQHYGRENKITNNIFAFGDEGVIASTRKEEHIEFMLEKNIIVSNGKPFYKNPDPQKFTDNFNIYFDYSGLVHDEVSMAGFFVNAIFENPLFADLKNDDFRLLKNSPAFKIDFPLWDYNNAGRTGH